MIFLSCNQSSQSNANNQKPSSERKEVDLKEIMLTETKLGNLALNKLSEINILNEIKAIYPEFSVVKSVEQQDGPDFNLYRITYSEDEIFFISMDSNDTIILNDLWTNNKIIKDEYRVTVGQKIENVLEKRPTLKFHSDLHRNIYATDNNSKIEYRLKGNFKSLNDTTFFAKDYSVEKWQTDGMEIEYLIWRK